MSRSLLGTRPTTLLKKQLYTQELIHRCTIQKPTTGATDGYGQPSVTWTEDATNVPCRLNWHSASEKLWEFEGVIADYKLFVGNNVDVPETCRIVDVKDADGNVVDAGPFDIVSRQRFDTEEYHHQELLLKRTARSGRGF